VASRSSHSICLHRAAILTLVIRRHQGKFHEARRDDDAKLLREPLSTYRLQFHKGFRFADVTTLVPYLQALGVSHLYASSYLKARAGSLHGYDIVDHNAINPEIGSEGDFDAMCSVLAAHGMSQILDIVPNHMGVLQSDNIWWNDVLENGRSSPWAETFDIDWQPSGARLEGQVLLAVLGGQYGQVLESGELRLVYSVEMKEFVVSYFENSVPVRPVETAFILSRVPLPEQLDAGRGERIERVIER
jgi:maltooligosyltrehalose synthase